jgi:hypothetical protein
METFDEMDARIKAEVLRDEIDEGIVRRVVGTQLEPRLSKLAGNRYCALCDEWMRARVCKACGLGTEKAEK